MSNDFLEFLRMVAGDLSFSDEPLHDATVEELNNARSVLERMHLTYQAEAPEGAEEVRECMLESIELFLGAIEKLEAVNEGEDTSLLSEAISQAEEAADLLEQIEHLMQGGG